MGPLGGLEWRLIVGGTGGRGGGMRGGGSGGEVSLRLSRVVVGKVEKRKSSKKLRKGRAFFSLAAPLSRTQVFRSACFEVLQALFPLCFSAWRSRWDRYDALEQRTAGRELQ